MAEDVHRQGCVPVYMPILNGVMPIATTSYRNCVSGVKSTQTRISQQV